MARRSRWGFPGMLAENSICLAGELIRIIRRKRLPPQTRVHGGWWWTWRWRFEFVTGWLDLESVVAVRRALVPGDVVLDIGAHAGYYSLLFSRLVGPSGAVFSFEPDPVNFGVLQHNLRGSGAENAGAFNLAISERCGPVSLHRSAGSGNHSLFPYTEPVEIISVRSTTVDAFLAARGKPEVALIKLDIEGAEPLALAGMGETLSRCHGVRLIVEYNPKALRSAGDSPEHLLQSLRSLGFRLWRLELDKAPEPVETFLDPEPQSAINLFCSRLGPPGEGGKQEIPGWFRSDLT